MNATSLRPLRGNIVVPPDKSITHRALIFNALAEGRAILQNPLNAEDTQATIQVLRQLGTSIDWLDTDTIEIKGLAGKFNQPAQPLNFANSGTSVRMCMGLLAAQPFRVTYSGDDSLSKRPMARVLLPLQTMGIQQAKSTFLPITLIGNTQLHGIEYTLPMPSAQVKTAILLAAIQARGKTCVTLPAECRNHSEILLQQMGITLAIDQLTTQLYGPQRLTACSIAIPGDFSAAAFWIVAACIIPNSTLTIKNVGINPTRTALLDVLKQMGATIHIENSRSSGGETIADLHILAAPLSGVTINPAMIANLQDEIPILLIAAAFASGATEIRGAAELRVKESDRLQAMSEGLRACGIQTELYSDGILVRGGKVTTASIKSYGDHRIAMAFLIAGLCSQQLVAVDNIACIKTSYPNFINELERLRISS